MTGVAYTYIHIYIYVCVYILSMDIYTHSMHSAVQYDMSIYMLSQNEDTDGTEQPTEKQPHDTYRAHV